MTCSTSSGSMTSVLSSSRHLKLSHVVFYPNFHCDTCPVSLSMVGYMATDEKYTQNIFELRMFTILIKISEYVVSYNYLETGQSGTNISSDMIWIFTFSKEMWKYLKLWRLQQSMWRNSWLFWLLLLLLPLDGWAFYANIWWSIVVCICSATLRILSSVICTA